MSLVNAFAQGLVIPPFQNELWGRAHYGEGYVYGLERSIGLAVVDIDNDNDNDYFLPTQSDQMLLMRNLGNAESFFPGNPRGVQVNHPQEDQGIMFNGYFMDFADATGDRLNDLFGIIFDANSGQQWVAWFRNTGTANQAEFDFEANLFEEVPSTFNLGAVDVTDLNGDGLVDVCFLAFFPNAAQRSHRVFVMANIGTETEPDWSPAVEFPSLGERMPPKISKSAGVDDWYGELMTRLGMHDRTKGLGAIARVTDIEFADWNGDGLVDFQFFDVLRGVDWVRNEGGSPVPDWSDSINPDGIAIFDATTAYTQVNGSFALKRPPITTALSEGERPRPDLHILYDGILQIWRYNYTGGIYEVVQQSAASFHYGNGQPAFLDFDLDGDLDLFTTTFTTQATEQVFYIENIGAPYAPAWNRPIPINGPLINPGNASNGWRPDQYGCFYFNDGFYGEFYRQAQDGAIEQYEIGFEFNSDFNRIVPVLQQTQNNDMGLLWTSFFQFDTGVQPRGFAIGDIWPYEFDAYGVGGYYPEILAVIYSNEGGYFLRAFQDPINGGWGYDDFTTLLTAPDGGTLLPNTIESINIGDLNLDGLLDLILSIQEDPQYKTVGHHVYWNLSTAESALESFEYGGRLDAIYDRDPGYARYVTPVDIDSDADLDLFVQHQAVFEGVTDPRTNRLPYMRFYRNNADTGLLAGNLRVVSGRTVALVVNDGRPPFSYIFNASGGELTQPNGLTPAFYTAGPTTQVVDIVQSFNTNPNWRIFVDVLPAVGVESKAIIVVGGDPGDSLYPTFQLLGRLAHYALQSQGLAKENIRLYASGSIDADNDGASDVFAQPTISALQNAVTSWAAGTQRLVVYFVDHGQRFGFPVNATEVLGADTYAQWLNTLQGGANPPIVTTVIDTCEAGTFLEPLALNKKLFKGGAQRITITGADRGPLRGVALFDKVTGVSFSLPFWSNVAGGATYGEAFEDAKVAIQTLNPLQHPQIDDDGDGVGNESNDGLVAEDARPGADFSQFGTGVFIGEVAPPAAIQSASHELWLSDILTNFAIQSAGALVVPPNLSRDIRDDDAEQPITGLTWVPFAYDDEADRWEATYDGFVHGGLYRILYYVQAGGTFFASPRIGYVDRVGVPDAWEPDNSPVTANWTGINLSQGHNFHVSGDEDWVRIALPQGQMATIAVADAGPRCKPIIELYRRIDLEADPNAAPIATAMAPAPGRGATLEYTPDANGAFAVRIRNAVPNVFGEGTSYLFIVAVGTGGLFPHNLFVTVVDGATSQAVPDAEVQATGSGGTVLSTTDSTGVAILTLADAATYQVQATRSGYSMGATSKVVNNQNETITIELDDLGTGDVSVTINANRTGVTATVDGEEYGLPRTFSWAPGSNHSLVAPQTLSDGSAFAQWSDGNTNPSRTYTASQNLTLTAQYSGGTGADGEDVNGDGKVDAVDIQLVINGALAGTSGITDINGDGVTNAVDVQLVILAALSK